MTAATLQAERPVIKKRRGRLQKDGLVLATTRALMREGTFRPTVVEVSKKAGCSVRTVFKHFRSLDALYQAALDEQTQDAIADRIGYAHRERIVVAAVFGRL